MKFLELPASKNFITATKTTCLQVSLILVTTSLLCVSDGQMIFWTAVKIVSRYKEQRFYVFTQLLVPFIFEQYKS